MEPKDTDQYNEEIDAAVNRVRNGESISNDDVMNELDEIFDGDEIKGYITTNIKIAKFMGWKIDNSFPDQDKVWRSPNNNIELDSTFKFHYDWNLLMEVVQKIESLGYIVSNDLSDTTILENQNNSMAFINVFGTTKGISKKKSIYTAVVKFIDYYNVKLEMNN